MRFRLIVPVLLCWLVPAGCDSAPEAPPVLQGRYEGMFTYVAPPGPFSPGGEVSQAWTLTLQEAGHGVVSGAGSLGTMSVSITGMHDHPDVRLEFTDEQGASAGRFTGVLSDDGRVLDGRYTFNLFFVNLPVTLRLP